MRKTLRYYVTLVSMLKKENRYWSNNYYLKNYEYHFDSIFFDFTLMFRLFQIFL